MIFIRVTTVTETEKLVHCVQLELMRHVTCISVEEKGFKVTREMLMLT